MEYSRTELLYENQLTKAEDIADFVLEGRAGIEFSKEGMALAGETNFLLWCPVIFPDGIEISWRFKPLNEPGLAMMFFHASSALGGLFEDTLAPRDGSYPQYHSGDINCLHLSYFRRKYEDERAFHTCNLRKSKGFHLVAQGADPIPDVLDAKDYYELKLAVRDGAVAFSVDDLPVLTWQDDGSSFGEVFRGGQIGFRQMAPMVGRYAGLKVWRI